MHIPITKVVFGDEERQAVQEQAGASTSFGAPTEIEIEVADLVFAVDSVPAILAITTDPFIV